MTEPMDDPRDTERPPGDAQAGTPRWVRVSLIIAAAVVLLVVILLLLGGHGPSRHLGPQDAGNTSPALERSA